MQTINVEYLYSDVTVKQEKCHITKAGISVNKDDKYSTNLLYVGERKRGRCGSCSACTRDDCGQCRYYLDTVKFGGPGKKRQACILRKCNEMNAFKDLQSNKRGHL